MLCSNLCVALYLYLPLVSNFPYLSQSIMGETKSRSKAIIRFQSIQDLSPLETTRLDDPLYLNARLCYNLSDSRGTARNYFACLSISEKREQQRGFEPTTVQLLNHPLAALSYVPKDAAIFAAGAVAGAVAKTVTAPLDRIKLLMQTHGVRAGQESAKKAIGFIEAIALIGKEEGIKGYWKGNLPQVIRIIPYSAVQLFAYETYKKLFKGKDGELSVVGRLAAGACAGMTSTFITYPLDVLRLRLAVEPGYRKMSEVALNMLREEGFASFYYGLGPSLIGIAPYIAVNFCIFDLVKRALPEKYRQKTQASLLTAVVSALAATVTCYPLDTVRRQMQMKGTPYKSVLEAIPGIIEREGVIGLYRGFVPNALKNLPNSSIRLTTFDIVKRLVSASEEEFQKIVDENCLKEKQETNVEEP
ncbi:Thylakoid ADP,ATP carrier, chloroplastic -like protein [Gossypium arboreum]|uniref:Uncharacterized protein n=2 Tax=Gossypium arboreum TaxID=29729 RepID=A0ABR0QBQ2_GOSAR|nr:probable envelope ADP,ATP carrier protein, chloroplastic [Gossypium arboreum]KAK5836755.1 hypothetical protein PVK06_012556 [Gossypium arboreum]KHG20589.1 Thylakoid ADP,ATP carrier, chloroplastic -like protein [Gossypium arboreum]